MWLESEQYKNVIADTGLKYIIFLKFMGPSRWLTDGPVHMSQNGNSYAGNEKQYRFNGEDTTGLDSKELNTIRIYYKTFENTHHL